MHTKSTYEKRLNHHLATKDSQQWRILSHTLTKEVCYSELGIYLKDWWAKIVAKYLPFGSPRKVSSLMQVLRFQKHLANMFNIHACENCKDKTRLRNTRVPHMRKCISSPARCVYDMLTYAATCYGCIIALSSHINTHGESIVWDQPYNTSGSRNVLPNVSTSTVSLCFRQACTSTVYVEGDNSSKLKHSTLNNAYMRTRGEMSFTIVLGSCNLDTESYAAFKKCKQQHPASVPSFDQATSDSRCIVSTWNSWQTAFMILCYQHPLTLLSNLDSRTSRIVYFREINA